MSMYAVVDPATGETLKEYPTITDDELRDGIARADRAHRGWPKATTVADRAALVCGNPRAEAGPLALGGGVGEFGANQGKELAKLNGAEKAKPVRQARG